MSVTGYNQKITHTDARTVSAAIAYDTTFGETIILVIHQEIHISGLKHNLLCPMQMRLNDVKISELPKFLAKRPTDKIHAITIPETNDADRIVIPLLLHGVTSYFPTRKPTVAEYEKEYATTFELTFETPEWDPHSVDFSNQEDNWTDSSGLIREPGDKSGAENRFFNSSASHTLPHSQSNLDDAFLSALLMNVNISGVKSSGKRYSVTTELLAQTWDVYIHL